MLRPVGRPAALKVLPAVATTCKETVAPSRLVWVPGLVTATPVTVQANFWLALLVPSDAVTVTKYGLAPCAVDEIVPEITPVVVLMVRPVGRPVARYVSGLPLS